jgi:hypothetical protein
MADGILAGLLQMENPAESILADKSLWNTFLVFPRVLIGIMLSANSWRCFNGCKAAAFRSASGRMV